MKKKIFAILMVVVILVLVGVFFAMQSQNNFKMGSKLVTIIVVQEDGSETEHECRTDTTNLEDLFAETDFVKGEQGPYGLYITEVDGVFAKYEENGAYWAMYKGDEMLMTGAKDTLIDNKEVYKLVYTKM